MKVLLWRNKLEQLARGEIPIPVTFTIDPSNRCNFDCEWCFVHKYRRDNSVDLDEKIFNQIIDELAVIGVCSIALCGGGEPLMNKATISQIKHIADHGMKAGIMTNGSLLKPGDEAVIAHCCDYIRISLDAGSEHMWQEVHKTKMGWLNTLQSIQKILALRKGQTPQVGISFLVSPANYREIVAATKLSKSMGTDYIAFKMVYTGLRYMRDVGYDGKEFFVKHNDMLWRLFHEAMQLKDEKFDIAFRHLGLFERNEIARPTNYYSKCRTNPLSLSGIDPNGNIYCCCERRGELLIGRYPDDGSFNDLWFSDKHKEVLASINLDDCPDRCCHTGHNEIVEKVIIEDVMKQNWA
jgi:MoaA/NifB/PqqE/SkfB family radical SAM enzyme